MSAGFALRPSCRDVTGLLSEYLEGRLSWRQRLGIRLHLGLCPPCQRLLRSLRALPGLVRRTLDAPAEAPPGSALAALEGALARIGQPRVRPIDPARQVPADFAAELAAGPPGRTLALLAETHRRLAETGVAAGPPYLPPEVLAQLPPPADWAWLRPTLPGLRIVRLAEDPQAALYLLALRPGKGIPAHVHGGRESFLLLQGGLEDGGRLVGPGEWVVHAADSRHAPSADGQGCWALARLEGEPAFTGLLGLLQRWSGQPAERAGA